MKNVSLPLLIVHAAVLLLGILTAVCIPLSRTSSGSSDIAAITGPILGFFFILSVIAAEFMTHFILILRFYRRMFANEGYLTNSLPLSADQLILSHTLTYFTWCIVDFLVLGVVLFSGLAINGQFWNFFTQLNNSCNHAGAPLGICIPLFIALLCVSSILLSELCHIATSIGSFSAAHKGLLSFFMYIIFLIVFQVASFIFLVAAALNDGFGFINYNNVNTGSLLFNMSNILPYAIATLILMTAVAAVFYFFSRLIVRKHLNLA